MGWASALRAVVLASILVVVCLGWIYLLLTLWALRDRYEIAVRCPSLNAVVQITFMATTLSILLQWLLLIMDESLPCFVVLFTSYTILAFGTTPTLIRASRLVVAFSRRYRAKYARFVKATTTSRVWAVIAVAFFVRGATFFGSKPEHYSRNARECFFMDDTVLVVGLAVFVGPPAILLVLSLSKVDDAFKIREELLASIVLGLFLIVIALGIQVLVDFNILLDTPQAHIIVEVLMLLLALNFGIWGLLIPVVRAHRNGLRARFRGNIIPVENADDAEAFTAMRGVLALAAVGGEMADKFETFCIKHLCQESWDFIVDATRYEKMAVDDPDAQHNAFLHILHQYLLSTSPNEVNISSTSSKRMMSFRTRESFGHLDDEERRRVLQGPLGEVVQMLEENLLHKFWRHVAAEQDAQMAELAGGDRELMELMKKSSRAILTGTASS